MKEFFTDFLKLLSNSILVICFALMSFLLISNFYHSNEVSYAYTTDLNNYVDYNNYKKTLKEVDKKMNSVDYSKVEYANTAKPIYDYYKGCVDALNSGSFSKFESNNDLMAVDIYNANSEILKEYNNKCIFNISYNIANLYDHSKPNVSFDSMREDVEQKGDIVLKNAEYLTKSGLGNSSYGFTTDTSRATIYNKISNELNITVNNYKMIAFILDDIADWYVAEYGGNV